MLSVFNGCFERTVTLFAFEQTSQTYKLLVREGEGWETAQYRDPCVCLCVVMTCRYDVLMCLQVTHFQARQLNVLQVKRQRMIQLMTQGMRGIHSRLVGFGGQTL